jgi:CheY-like chemotaxis protein
VSTILLVDDETDLHDVYKFYLEDQGYTFISAYDGREALEALDCKSNIDMIVSDISMPGFSGIELLQRIREKNLVTPIAFVTGYATKENCISALRFGAFDIVEKPIEKQRLLDVVKEGVSLSTRARQVGVEQPGIASMAHAKLLANNDHPGTTSEEAQALHQCRLAVKKCHKLAMLLESGGFERAKLTLICRSMQLVVENLKEMTLPNHLAAAESVLRALSTMRMQTSCYGTLTAEQVQRVLADFENFMHASLEHPIDQNQKKRILDFEIEINRYLKQCA